MMILGTVGSKTRQEYALVGDIVNLSARLMVRSSSPSSQRSRSRHLLPLPLAPTVPCIILFSPFFGVARCVATPSWLSISLHREFKTDRMVLGR